MNALTKVFDKIRNKAPSWGWALYFIVTGITAVLVTALVYFVISTNYVMWINWFATEASWTEMVFFAILFSLLVWKPFYLWFATYTFFKETLAASTAGR